MMQFRLPLPNLAFSNGLTETLEPGPVSSLPRDEEEKVENQPTVPNDISKQENSPGSSISSLLTEYESTTRSDSFKEGQNVWLLMSELKEKNNQTNHNFEERRIRDRHSNQSNCCRMMTSMDDLRSLMFWKAVFAECLGTFLLVLLALGACLQGYGGDPLDVLHVGLAFGFSVTTSVWIIGHISGGHINPAITFAMLITRRVSLLRAVLFIVAQSVGAIVAAALLKGLTPEEQQGPLGTTTLNVGVTPSMGFAVEFFITFTLVLTVFACCDSKRTDHGGSIPLAVGIAVTMGHLWAVEFTGSSMNPARSLGPAVVMNIWSEHWVYWVGPLSGGLVAGLLYDNVLASNASIRKAKDLLMASRFDDERYPAVKRKIHVVELEDEEAA